MGFGFMTTTGEIDEIMAGIFPVGVADASIQMRFEAFHRNNPQVYTILVRLARRGRGAGRNRLGMKMLFEVVRWEWIIAGLPDDSEEFKLNNNYTSRYARLIMEQEGDLTGIFDTRGLRSE